jgi:hypothetical protein
MRLALTVMAQSTPKYTPAPDAPKMASQRRTPNGPEASITCIKLVRPDPLADAVFTAAFACMRSSGPDTLTACPYTEENITHPKTTLTTPTNSINFFINGSLLFGYTLNIRLKSERPTFLP